MAQPIRFLTARTGAAAALLAAIFLAPTSAGLAARGGQERGGQEPYGVKAPAPLRSVADEFASELDRLDRRDASRDSEDDRLALEFRALCSTDPIRWVHLLDDSSRSIYIYGRGPPRVSESSARSQGLTPAGR